MLRMTSWTGLWALGALALAACATVQDGENDAVARDSLSAADELNAPGPHAPPPEAFAACMGLAEGAGCVVAIDDEGIEGTCRSGPNGGGPLACAPNDMPPPPPPHAHRGPPPEAVAACAALAKDAACSITLAERTIDGTCRSGPNGEGPLACAPANMPPPPPPPGPPPEPAE